MSKNTEVHSLNINLVIYSKNQEELDGEEKLIF